MPVSHEKAAGASGKLLRVKQRAGEGATPGIFEFLSTLSTPLLNPKRNRGGGEGHICVMSDSPFSKMRSGHMAGSPNSEEPCELEVLGPWHHVYIFLFFGCLSGMVFVLGPGGHDLNLKLFGHSKSCSTHVSMGAAWMNPRKVQGILRPGARKFVWKPCRHDVSFLLLFGEQTHGTAVQHGKHGCFSSGSAASFLSQASSPSLRAP